MAKVETSRFACRGDNGKEYTVVFLTSIVTQSDNSGGVSKALGSTESKLDDGRDVNQISERVFEILTTGEKITKIEQA